MKTKMKDFVKQIKELALENGLEVDLDKGTIYNEDALVKLTLNVTELSGKSIAQKEFEMYAPKFNIPLDSFGKEIEVGNLGSVRICGISPRARKYPLLVTADGSKKYKIEAFHALNAK